MWRSAENVTRAGHVFGSVKEKQLPLPGSLSTQILPP